MMHAGVLNPKLKCYPVSKNVDRITLLELIQLLKIYSASYSTSFPGHFPSLGEGREYGRECPGNEVESHY
jgi:hypothetical protein